MLQLSESKPENDNPVIDQPITQGRARFRPRVELVCRAVCFPYLGKPVLNSEMQHLSVLTYSYALCACRQGATMQVTLVILL